MQGFPPPILLPRWIRVIILASIFLILAVLILFAMYYLPFIFVILVALLIAWEFTDD